MLLGAVTYNVIKDWDLNTILTKLPELGFEAVELRTTHAHGVEVTLSAEERIQVQDKFHKAGLRLLSYGSTCEFHSPDPEVRKKHVEDAKKWIDLAHDTGAWGIKVRPNGIPKELPQEVTIKNIAACLKELGDYGAGRGIETWMEVHGAITQLPPVSAQIMRETNHPQVGVCWNSNPTDVINGSVKQSFDLLKPWIKNVHITELVSGYPYRELFSLLKQAKYQRYTLCEAQGSPEPERFLRWYRAMWTELQRSC